jgi:TPR repeat protein
MGQIFTVKFIAVIFVVFIASTAFSYAVLSDRQADVKSDVLIDKALGLSVDGYYKEAFDILEPLANEGITRAQLYLATAYYHGNGVRRNIPKALHLFLALQDKNYEPGIVNTYLNLIGSLQHSQIN